jgi:hypothetical protein
MGGPSFKTEKDHKDVFDRYERMIKEYGEMAKEIRKSTFHKRISDETGYSEVAVRTIINSYEKPNKQVRKDNKERLCRLLKRTSGVI